MTTNKDALIGYSGYIGSFLRKKKKFSLKYNSKNIRSIKNEEINDLYLAAPSALKYFANSHPNKDKQNIKNLIKYLKKINCKKIIYFSTIDACHPKKNDYYGTNRKYLENFIKKNFKNHLIIRLPGLFGWNLRKNFFYDILKNNSLKFHNSKTELQWYFIENILKDIKFLKKKKIKLINLVSEPIALDKIANYLNHKTCDFNQKEKIYKYNFKMKSVKIKKKYNQSKIQILKKMKLVYQQNK
jgi:hypothetical protein